MKLAIFDLDGTLTATTAIDDYCFAKAFLDEFGFAIRTDWDAKTPCDASASILIEDFRNFDFFLNSLMQSLSTSR